MMEYISSIVTVIGLFLLGIVSPGPNFLVVTQQSLKDGKKAGIIAGLGIALADFIYASAGLFGLATLISLVGWLLGSIKFLGGLYLIYLGVKMTKSKRVKSNTSQISNSAGLNQCFRLGLFTGLTNPKTIIFFASIFATTITSTTPEWALGCMLAAIVLTSILWRIGLAYLFSRDLFRVSYVRFQKTIEFVFGTALILFGFRLSSSVVIQPKR